MPSLTCLPEVTSLDVIESVTFGTPRSFSHKLQSTNIGGTFVTGATLEGQFDGKQLSLGFRFEQEGVSNPYNIFAVLVATANAALAWHDLTGGCTGPGISIYPRGNFDLPAVKNVPPDTSQLHVIVWGHL